MNIQSISQYTSYETKTRLSKRKIDTTDISPDKAADKKTKDTYEPSNADDRKKLIESVKKRIKSGYYHSDEVNDDLSDAFAKTFNDILFGKGSTR